MNRLAEFYKGLLEALDFVVDDNGNISMLNHGTKIPIMLDGKPLVLPTDENIKSAIEIIDGKPTFVKALFNPLEENAIKGENKSFQKLKTMIELKLLGVIYTIGEVIFSNFARTDVDIEDVELMRLISILNRYKAPGVKKIIDDKSIENWVNLYEKILKEHLESKYVKFYIKRGGKIGEIKYNRVGVETFPFLEQIVKINPKKESFLGIKVRNKDIHAYTSLFEFMFGKLDDLIKGKQFGSLNKIAPGTHVLLLMYSDIQSHLSGIIESLMNLGIDDETRQKLDIKPLPVLPDALGDMIDSLENEIKRVPTEASMVSQPVQQATVVSQYQPTQTTNVNNNESTGSFWDRVGGNTSTQQVIPQTSVQQPSQIMTQPMNQQVVNPSLTMMQQPVIQQPMMQQDPWSTPNTMVQPQMGMMQQPMMQTYNPNDPWG